MLARPAKIVFLGWSLCVVAHRISIGQTLDRSEPSKATSSVIEAIDWTNPSKSIKTQKDNRLAGEVLEKDQSNPARLKLDFTNNKIDSSETVCIARFDEPRITQKAYYVRGKVRYSRVSSSGYIEMLHHSENGQVFFSRTLDESGPMGKIVGDSAWREFTTPMFLQGEPGPKRIDMNLVIPGSGEIEIAALELVDGVDGLSFVNSTLSDAWWSDRTGGWIGGMFGVIFGCLGPLAGWLARRGHARGWVLGGLTATTAIGLVSIITCLIALAFRQPYGVWYPLALAGTLLTVLSLSGRVSFSKIYSQLELQRMNAIDS